jgi:DNA-directed RNA polymerase specialized sigma24 family protein
MKTMTTTTNSTSNLQSANPVTPWIDRMPRPSRTPDPFAMLNDVGVVKPLRGKLLRLGVAFQDRGDAVAEVQARAIKSTHGKRLPATVEEWRNLCLTIAKRMIITDCRRQERRGRWHAGLCEKPDDTTPPEPEPWRRNPAEAAEYLRILKAQFEAGEMPEHGETILQRTADGETARRIGKDLGLSQRAVEKRLERMRKLFSAKLASLGMLVMMLLVAIFFAMPMESVVSRPLPQETPEMLRHEALEACDAAQWRECLDELDAAKSLDPAGDDAPEIRDARERAERALADQR